MVQVLLDSLAEEGVDSVGAVALCQFDRAGAMGSVAGNHQGDRPCELGPEAGSVEFDLADRFDNPEDRLGLGGIGPCFVRNHRVMVIDVHGGQVMLTQTLLPAMRPVQPAGTSGMGWSFEVAFASGQAPVHAAGPGELAARRPDETAVAGQVESGTLLIDRPHSCPEDRCRKKR